MTCPWRIFARGRITITYTVFSPPKRMKYYSKIQLLFIDDFAISRYSEEGIKILYHLIKMRTDAETSTMFSCQYSPDE